ncbi:lysine--tRNA ligase [Candidatus Kaiserbacteria bacterium RIFCSPHIGHO2_01_FULL_50_13]|uniref:lysine--tRNA ligase n=1 Tax=Candidatus Kaiserbacteria bacterium RIFCSPLOWO2_01_FULL_50_24 TaxID=1798507 RepID=A0A1F6ER74_9BACT|nr:MAG: lysine--tRNA ligase [Candidatus Kaiserbacteria bacterium RIFCSPHIGHO2_01_FULL_50_13]OGG76131.1 MAG: lysine--tRNA ligase [Candidatus Kaiserbacteria bacterium RIFCSPLOWO2_01_FULL_50_24]OGG82338.1 MAG: lysine--tRNA ligase [Candidatus Kaiserbacteria bacterium RIFCSPLOWO2_02_FULL_51_13]
MSSEDNLRAERLKKLKVLKSTGMEAYPAATSRTLTNADFSEQFDELEKSRASETVAGRIMSLRGQGGIMFATIFDGSIYGEQSRTTSLTTGGAARLQLVFQKEHLDEKLFSLFRDVVDHGDFIEAAGIAYRTKRGEKSLLVDAWHMLAKSLMSIPDEWFGLKDEEKRLRERYLDMLLNDEVREMVLRRAKFWQAVRNFYLERGFLEVETPTLESYPGGADARPFVTHHNALNIDVYLRIALELWHKRMLVAGFPKVFEIGRVFRNEGQSREHLQDYTMFESYEAYSDMQKGMQFVQELYRHIAKEVYEKYTFEIGGHTVDFAEDWSVLDFGELLKKHFGIEPLACSEEQVIRAAKDARIVFGEAPNKARAVDHLWKQLRKKISGPAFLTGVPVYLEPLAKRSRENPEVVERMQIILAGSEVGKGFSELNDPEDQRARFEVQQKLRDTGDEEAQRMDKEYLRAMEYGMPPAFGFGVSERLFAFLENKPAHEAQLFPLLRSRQ